MYLLPLISWLEDKVHSEKHGFCHPDEYQTIIQQQFSL